MKWTKEAVIEANATLPPVYNDEIKWAEVWVRPATEFGLELTTNARRDESDWNTPLWVPENLYSVPVELIKYTTNHEGIRIDVLAWYLQDVLADTENFDEDGWFNNDYPVLIENADGTYTIRDGSHRTISQMLKGAQIVPAYVMEGPK